VERVAFLIERTGEQISCLLNPESVIVRRTAGLRSRTAGGGIATGAALSDDPVIATGGGVTELELDLLFDVDLARSLAPQATEGTTEDAVAPASEMDVRDLTRPIWNLAENAEGEDGFGVPPVIRLIWGRSWNVPAVVTAVAERLQRFSSAGAPQRSWLRLRLRRVADTGGPAPLPKPVTPQFEVPPISEPGVGDTAPRLELPVDEDGFPSRRLDDIAAERYGDPAAWRLIATLNDVANPLALSGGLALRLDGSDRKQPT
jgi:hypothetical protein